MRQNRDIRANGDFTLNVYDLIRYVLTLATFTLGIVCMGSALFAVHALGFDQLFGAAGIVSGFVVCAVGLAVGEIE